MKKFFIWIDPLRLLSFALFVLPILAVFGFGVLWLWQTGSLLYWLVATLLCGVSGYGLQQWLMRRDRRLLAEIATEPNPDWPPSANVVWQQVEELADSCEPQDWPLESGSWILELGRRTLEAVSHCYYPKVERPLLELTVPHTLLIIERASRDLRRDVTENIPFSARLTIGDLFRLQHWKTRAEQAFNIYRAGRMIINPANALLGEALRHFQARSFGLARQELHRWFLRAYVRKVGYYAIDLYSGRLPLDESRPEAYLTSLSSTDMNKAEEASKVSEEPLRILVLGRANAGKSSLINALFGNLTTPYDVLPDTTQSLKPFVLSREGLTQALIFDSPGCDSSFFKSEQMQKAVLEVDLILWVSPANRPDRKIERDCLDSLRKSQSERMGRRPPSLLVVASHIDLLRPMNEWQPPYDLVNQQNTKAINIYAAVQAIATDLAVPVERVIPVCLKDGRVYNVEDALWSAILDLQDEALRVRLLRCLDTNKRKADWAMLRRQLIATGRFILSLPGKLESSGQRTKPSVSDISSNQHKPE